MGDRLEDRRVGAQAFLAMQRELPKVGKDSQGHGYEFMDLPTFLSAVMPVLHKHDLTVNWQSEVGPDGTHTMTCFVLHVLTGYRRTSTFPLDAAGWEAPPRMSAPQKVGAVATYMRRYTLQDVIGFCPDMDLDCPQGEAAAAPAATPDPGRPVNPAPLERPRRLQSVAWYNNALSDVVAAGKSDASMARFRELRDNAKADGIDYDPKARIFRARQP